MRRSIDVDKINTATNTEISFFETTGFSMWPFIKEGERLVVKKVLAEVLKIGDVVVYRDGSNKLVCHRLIKKIRDREKCLFYLRGDNSSGRGDLIPKESIVGKVVGIMKNGEIVNLTGRWRNFVNRIVILIGPLPGMGTRIVKKILQIEA